MATRRVSLRLVPCLVFPTVGALWAVGVIGGNVREVAPGQFYRSAQLTGDTLARTIRDHRIASVLNLRGAHRGTDDYDSEVAVCRREGVVHADATLSATRLPRPEELNAVLSALDRLPRPVLVHCQGGSDRAGLVSAIYENVYEGVSVDHAEHEQLTWRYGHLPFGAKAQLDRFFDLYRRTGQGRSLRRWIERDYAGVYEACRHARPESASSRVALKP